MRLLADENIAGAVIRELRLRGHDVLSVKEELRSQRDEVVLARAAADRRLLITHDKDFGELALQWGLPTDCGILLLRLPVPASESGLRRLVDLVESRVDWTGHLTVATEDRIRMKPFPRRGTHPS